MPILDTFDPSCMELVAPAFSEPEIPCSTRLMINDSLLLSQLDDLLELSDPDHSSLPSIPRMTRFPEDYIRETAVAPQEKGRLTLMEDSSMSLESLIHFN